ncbi:MAG: hypothetical protein Q9227_000469 [Pyrenula ochraceoflavens]
MSSIEEASGRKSEELSSRLPNGPTKSRDDDSIKSSPPTNLKNLSSQQGHRRLVFSDPVAFRYLEEDPSTIVLDRRRKLQGYEIYVVEQWACSRVHPTFIITTYTGDPSHSIFVSILSVPTDEQTWSTRMRVYFEAVSQYHAREKETPLGTLMVINLSSFPSALTVIAIPDGDMRKHREDFIVNEDLKRLGCSGRAGMNLAPPLTSTQSKFHQLYRTSERVPLYASVLELVRMCQVALTLFGKLALAYADGLLCDVTEKAVNDWWSDIGTDMYNIEPSDGILGPTTVSALIGTLTGAFNRLKTVSAPVGKDVFDVNATKRAISHFQKAQKLERTRRLDRATLAKLHRVSAKAASNEGWTVPKAVKSTVAELGGKGGEMVMGIVGAREKVGIAEIETLDIEKFVPLVSGNRSRWLWHGKPIKTGSSDIFDNLADESNRVFSTDDQGNFVWTSRKRDSVWDTSRDRSATLDQPRQSTESRSGLDRLKDAVGRPSRRTHQRTLKDESRDLDLDEQHGFEPALETITSQQESGPSSVSPQVLVGKEDVVLSPDGISSEQELIPADLPDEHKSATDSPPRSRSHSPITRVDTVDSELPDGPPMDLEKSNIDMHKYKSFGAFDFSGPESTFLRRSRSAVRIFNIGEDNARVNRVPRHLSFSFVEDAVFKSMDLEKSGDTARDFEVPAEMRAQEAVSTKAQNKASRVMYLEQATVQFVQSQVSRVEEMDVAAQDHQEELNALYYQRLDDLQGLRAMSTDLLNDERLSLTDGLRQVEVLGQKLDYELNALQSRVTDVEEGVAEFERGVFDIESRVENLFHERPKRQSWIDWIGGFLAMRKTK